jgi:hypothetical protein
MRVDLGRYCAKPAVQHLESITAVQAETELRSVWLCV